MNWRQLPSKRHEDDEAPRRPASQRGTVDVWQTLQQSIGNAALGRIVAPVTSTRGKADDNDDDNDEEDEEIKQEPPKPVDESTEGESEKQAPVEGALEGLATEKESAEEGAGAENVSTEATLGDIEDEKPIVKEDAPHFRGTHVPPRGSRTTSPLRPVPVEAHLTLVSRSEQSTASAPSTEEVKTDPVTGALSLGSNVVNGSTFLDDDTFGEEHVKYNVDTPSWKADGGKVSVSARVFLDIDWQVRSLGRTGVSGPEDPAVSAATWSEIMADLSPNAKGKPRRESYWAPDLTEKHEKFHASDDIGRATLYLPTATAWMGKQTVTDPSDVVGTSLEVARMLTTVRDNVKADGWAYYHAGGEDRAYADGKSSYEQRVNAIGGVTAKEGFA